MRYMEFLGDGDSKAHKLLVQEAVYGDVDIEKLECVGHIQKRLGSRLRSLKKRLGKTPLADGKPIGGAGRLTDKRIDKLRAYFGKAIRQNTHNITAMQNAVMTINFGITADLRMITLIMTCVQKEKTPGVGSKGTFLREQRIMPTKSP